MGRREIAGAENKIILATIAVAGNETRGTFSTKEIALRAGVSEFTIFSHFHDKETLLDAADRYLYDRFYQNEIALAERYPKDFERFLTGFSTSFLPILRLFASLEPIRIYFRGKKTSATMRNLFTVLKLIRRSANAISSTKRRHSLMPLRSMASAKWSRMPWFF